MHASCISRSWEAASRHPLAIEVGPKRYMFVWLYILLEYFAFCKIRRCSGSCIFIGVYTSFNCDVSAPNLQRSLFSSRTERTRSNCTLYPLERLGICAETCKNTEFCVSPTPNNVNFYFVSCVIKLHHLYLEQM